MKTEKNSAIAKACASLNNYVNIEKILMKTYLNTKNNSLLV